jgi:putative serine protease PepD
VTDPQQPSDPADRDSSSEPTAPITGLPDGARSVGGSWTPPSGQPPIPPNAIGPTAPRPKSVAAQNPAQNPAQSPAQGPVQPSQLHPQPVRQLPQQYAAPWAQRPQADQGAYGPAGQPNWGPQPTLPLHLGTASRRRSTVPGWLWPAVATLALFVGLAGGALGGAIQDSLAGSDEPGTGIESTGAQTDAPLPAANGSVAAVAEKLLPSTVQIVAEYQGESDGATGSGFVLDRSGHIVTNNHVVASAAEDDGSVEIVDQEGNHFTAEILGRSAVYDLAVLQVEGAKQLPPAALGSSTALNIGDPVVAFGAPLGLTSTVTAGIISARDRPVTTGDSADDASYINAVQTDAAINPGNSGGPLVDLQGRVIGVNSAIATTGGYGEAGNIGVGFAIPIEQVKVTVDQILKTGQARYPVIGAKVQTGGKTDEGAEISEVLPDSPAEEAGLKRGDVVTRIGEDRVTDGIALIVKIRTHQPGDRVDFTVERDGEQRQVSLTLDGEVG